MTLLSRTLSQGKIIVGQYRLCVDAGVCTEPDDASSSIFCNWSSSVGSKENLPVNCVDWFQARTFSQWVGGDLSSESEWEYAARGQGQYVIDPWGDDTPTCDLAVSEEYSN